MKELFRYGYLFEYYFGEESINRKNVQMSVFQISDDGFYISSQDNKRETNIASFEPSQSSHSYLIFNVSVFKKECTLWLSDPDYPEDDYDHFLTKFLQSSSDIKITKNNKGEVSILKKYEMQRFERHIHEINPEAFVVTSEGVGIDGNFQKKLSY